LLLSSESRHFINQLDEEVETMQKTIFQLEKSESGRPQDSASGDTGRSSAPDERQVASAMETDS